MGPTIFRSRRRGLALLLPLLLAAGCKRAEAPRPSPTNAPRRAAAAVPPRPAPPAPSGGAVTHPVAVETPAPAIPENLRAAALAEIVVQATVEPDGSVSQAHIVKPSPVPGASRACAAYFERAVARWRYRPATYHGKPVRTFLTIPFVRPGC